MLTRENLKTTDLRDYRDRDNSNTPNQHRTPRTHIERLDTDQKDLSSLYIGNTSEININDKQSEKSFNQLRNKTMQSGGYNSKKNESNFSTNKAELLSRVFGPNKVETIFQPTNTNTGFYTQTQQLNSTFDKPEQAPSSHDYNRKKSNLLIFYINRLLRIKNNGS